MDWQNKLRKEEIKTVYGKHDAYLRNDITNIEIVPVIFKKETFNTASQYLLSKIWHPLK